MLLIGMLEQLSLPLVLQRIETYAKTGLLVIKQEAHCVELYFRDGRLMCIGPVRANATLGDRLLQAGIISPQALQEAIFATGLTQPGETRVALTLMDLGYVSHEGLRSWAMKEASHVLQVLLEWPNGEIYFKDGQQPPADRLLVALAPTALLPATPPVIPAAQPLSPLPQPSQSASIAVPGPLVQEQLVLTPTVQPVGSMSTAQLVADSPTNTVSFSSSAAPLSVGNIFGGSDVSNSLPLTPPQRVMAPLQPMCIDTSFMQPEMVLLPVDLSGLREQNLQLQLTPEQWRLLTRVDGRTSLQCICQELAVSPDFVRQVVGELIALGVVRVSYPSQQSPVHELSPVSRNLITSGLGNGYVTPGYAAMSPQPWDAATPTTEALPPTFTATTPFETKSQWGNGGNGATFVPGRGWVATPQPLQPVQPGAPFYANTGVYAQEM